MNENTRINFSALVETDLLGVVVLFHEPKDLQDGNLSANAFYVTKGLRWKRLTKVGYSPGTIDIAETLAQRFHCRFVDDSTNFSGYDGDWDGKPTPEHLINLEILARSTLATFQRIKRKK
jgi:hypothetical protein